MVSIDIDFLKNVIYDEDTPDNSSTIDNNSLKKISSIKKYKEEFTFSLDSYCKKEFLNAIKSFSWLFKCDLDIVLLYRVNIKSYNTNEEYKAIIFYDNENDKKAFFYSLDIFSKGVIKQKTKEYNQLNKERTTWN